MADGLILVLGATGTIGGAVVAQLTDAGQRVRIGARDLAKANRLFGGRDIVRADLDEPATLAEAFAGVDKAFIVSNGPGIPLEANAYAAAKIVGVKHIVRVSAQQVEFPEVASLMLGQLHLDAERQLRESGVAWTLLRPSTFSSNMLVPFLVDLREGAFLPAGNGKEAPVDPRDIAGVGVRALTSPGHEGKTYVLTGPELLSYAEMMAKLSAVVGRPLRHIDLPEADARARFGAMGVPALLVDAILANYQAVRAGRAAVTTTIPALLGRPARTFDHWLEDHSTALRAA